MEENRSNRERAGREHNKDYYRQRAIQRKKERELKKRRRKMVLAAVAVLLIVVILIVSLVSCVSGCVSSGNKSAQTQTETQPQTEATKPTEPATEKSTKNASGQVEPSYFDDAVFVGDSVTASFEMYVESQRDQGIDCLGDAYVLAATSLGYTNSFIPVGDENCVLPLYQGVQQPIEDSIAQMGAKKVYIMLGMNDIVQVDFDTALENAKKVIANIKAKSPDVKIHIESVTPMIESAQYDLLNNEKIRSYNEMMKSFAEENGYPYLDIYSVVADEKGNLKEEYCSDPDGMGLHFLLNADAKWEEYLLEHPEGE
ncbi:MULTISPECIES: GDSL-type esterase/lipase family protein [unclassified Ruminococcus]|uniref:GDSL-type esterase/lipase family protein n=1 Tax=unclassified Ruminococcus TaxID=2608920 RepID=UPI00210907A2|nr:MULTISPECIES: GDSL-type esterase/lipase family protein [unclassified Ruminococcus]MCQ4023364.1 hypothetical protein [Ruminococcus sp. zg-924]MCQ4115731.1 hypothetical protein [Ruminococcus sp. zg-921]